jgi:general secretion pathway protein D
MTKTSHHIKTLGLVVISTIFLASCAPQRIRNQATEDYRRGNYEAAIDGLQKGVAEYPESATLRAGLTSTRGEIVARLVAEISQQRAAGQFEAAEKNIRRGLQIDPGNARLQALESDLALTQKQLGRLENINKLIDEGKKAEALRVVEIALRDTPRQPDFLLLQRKLELDLRQDQELGPRRLATDRSTISLDFRNTPISTVLEAITKNSGINFILDRDVRQDTRVTVYLRSASLEDAIELVTGSHQLARRIVDPKTVLIYPNTPEKQKEHQEQVIRVFHLGNADAKATAAFLRSMLRVKDPYVDERVNLLAIREPPEIVALAERLVALHDLGDAEVMLEVEILEVRSTRLTELGINFPSSMTLTPLPATGATGLTVSSLRNINSERIGVSVSSMLINLKREVGDFNILANPKIRAKNREKARIMIGDKVPVITTTANSTGFVSESISYLDVGLKLDVEPMVSPDDEVTLKVALEVSSLAKEVRTTTGSLAYQLGSRNASTSLRLRDGETQLLGGLISNEDRSTSNRVPGLGDLPIAGRLFSSQKDDVQRTELVLAITPRILRTAARPDVAQAEMWVGTEVSTRLRPAPYRAIPVLAQQSEAPKAINAAPRPITAADTVRPSSVQLEVKQTTPARLSWQAPNQIKPGEVFSVELRIASDSPLRGSPLEITFPPSLLEIQEIAEGDFFRGPDRTTSFTHALNTNAGRLGIGILRSDSGGSAGQGTLLTLRLRARSSGEAELKLSSFRPISPDGNVAVGELPKLKLDIK